MYYSFRSFLSCYISACQHHCAAYVGGNETDYEALLQFKSMITNDPHEALSSWNASFHHCLWSGVYCGKRHRRVTALELEWQGLEGSLSPYVGNLSRLSRLRFLQLDSNKFTGLIPSDLSRCSNLEELGLSRNRLVGSIPKEIGFLSKLTYLSVRDNKLTGGIPPVLGNITSMTIFSATRNPFGGSIPDTLGRWNSLKELYVGACNLSGTIPLSIFNLSLLTDVSFPGNQLTGSLPSALGTMLPHLEYLQLPINQLTGPLPPSISNCSKLEFLEVHDNNFIGKLTIDFAKLKDIYWISLGGNIFGFGEADDMKFIHTLNNCTRLMALLLHNCRFQGVLPTSVGNLSDQLSFINLGGNHLYGNLPSSIGNLVGLQTLDLRDNRFTGNIPRSIGGCASLSFLSLKGNLFKGIVPPSISSIRGVMTLDLSHNNLSGQIPQFLEGLLLLEYVDLSFNDFEGEVPKLGFFAVSSAFSVLGNSRLCGGLAKLGLPKCTETDKHRKKFHLFIMIILIATTLFTILCFLYLWHKRSEAQPSQAWTYKRFMRVSYSQLLKATNGFSETNLIGEGGFGSVYKGILDHNDRLVAVKVIYLQNRGAQKSFIAECEAWRSIRHRNLLKIITSCSSIDYQGNDFKVVVYEFMPNGSLHDWLHATARASRLNLLQRINILIDVSSALDYLHNRCLPAIVHCDLKPSNILLDDDMVAHVGDFGLARFLGTDSNQNNTSGIRGTIGYAPPEYGVGSEMTSSGDVYSFGILLLEVMTGKRPTDDIFKEGLNLHKFVQMALPDNVTDVADYDILNYLQGDAITTQCTVANGKKIDECLASIVKIGVSCSVDSPPQRMNIADVVRELQHILDMLQNI